MNLFLQKMNVVRDLKEFLNEQGFQEVLTPVLRKNPGTLIPRIQLINGQALRDSHELQLRYLLSEYNSIYEIGSCFREESEENTSTNSREFLLMELFTSKHSLLDLKELTKQFLLRQKPDTVFYEISIAECIKNQFNIDLFHEDQEILIRKLKKIYPHENFLYDYEYVLHYIKKEIEQVKSYVDIEQARFGNTLKVIYDIDETNIKSPSLIIQPLVENAILHGILPMDNKNYGIVKVSVKNLDSKVKISVEDNGIGINQNVIDNIYSGNMPENKIGLYNVHLRLKLYYGKGLEITKLNKGTLIEFYIWG